MYIVDDQNLIKSNFEQAGVDLDVLSEKCIKIGMDEFLSLPLVKRNDVVLINIQDFFSRKDKIDELRSIANTFLAIYFFCDSNFILNEQVLNEMELNSKVVNLLTFPLPKKETISLINQFKVFSSLISDQINLQNHLSKMSLEIDDLFKQILGDYEISKKLHQALTPKRTEDIKGLKFQSKYESGPLGGGEFFDLIKSEEKIYLVLIHSDSYLISSSLMALLNKSKKLNFSPESFLENAQHDIDEICKSKKKMIPTDLLVLEMDLRDLKLRKMGHSSLQVIIKKNHFSEVSLKEEYQLMKGDILIIPSVGFRENWKSVDKNLEISKHLNENFLNQDMDLISYLFYKIRNHKYLNDLKKDSTILMMEVNRHGIHQI